MGGAYSVALVGFTHNESAAFDTFLRLAARQPPDYRVQDEVMDAQFLIVNADSPQALHLVRYAELPGQVLLLGRSDHGTGWPLQHKPVKGAALLAALDALVGAHPKAVPHPPAAALARPAAVPPSRALHASPRDGAHRASDVPARKLLMTDLDRGFAPTQPLPVGDLARLLAPVEAPRRAFGSGGSAAVVATSQRPSEMRLTNLGGVDAQPAPPVAVSSSRIKAGAFPSSAPDAPRPPRPSGQRGDMLLLAESLVEGRILYKRFQRYGLSIDWLREAGQALQMLKMHPYRAVAIDRLNGEPDVYQVCRSVKQRKLANGQSPVVIMFAPTAGSMDRMKAGLAGCDAYFSRAVGEGDLYKCLAQHRLLSQRAFAKTDIGC